MFEGLHIRALTIYLSIFEAIKRNFSSNGSTIQIARHYKNSHKSSFCNWKSKARIHVWSAIASWRQHGFEITFLANESLRADYKCPALRCVCSLKCHTFSPFTAHCCCLLVDQIHLVLKIFNMNIFKLTNPCGLNMALRTNQPLTGMSTRNLAKNKGWSTRKTDNHTAICEPIV
jgi:hypothetical protein